MTVTTTGVEDAYNGNGSTTGFDVTGQFWDEDELEVYLRDVTTGVETLQLLTTHYSVTGGAGLTGRVNFVTAPTDRVYIRRNSALTQQNDIKYNTKPNSAAVEESLDRSTLAIQEVDADLARTMRAPVTDTAADLSLPSSVARASKFLAFDSAGLPVVQSGLDESSVTATATGGTEAITHAERAARVFSPEDFGAIGDGLTDDSVAFQAALDYIGGAVAAGRLNVLAKTYRLDSVLTFFTGAVHIDMVPGSVLDFSNVGSFQNADRAAFIKVIGVTSTATFLATACVPDRTDQAMHVVAHGYAVGDLLKVSALTAAGTRSAAGQTSAMEGELVYVKHVTDVDNVLLSSAVHVTYLITVDAAYKITAPEFHISGGKILGPGANTGAGNGDRAIWLEMVDGFSVDGVEFEGCDFEAVAMHDCINGSVRNNRMTFDHLGASDDQRGIVFGDATMHVEIENNHVFSGGLAIEEVHRSVSSNGGISRYITIAGNNCSGQAVAGIRSNLGAEHLTIRDNHIHSTQIGIYCHWAHDTLIMGNRIHEVSGGIYVSVFADGLQIENNAVRDATTISISLVTAGATAGASVPWLTGVSISGNQLLGDRAGGSAWGILVLDSSTTSSPRDILIADNVITGHADAIHVESTPDPATGWSGKISGNSCRDVNNGILCENSHYVTISDNSILGDGTSVLQAIKVEGANAIGNRIFGNLFEDVAIDDVAISAGTGGGHETDAFVTESIEIDTGAVALEYTSTSRLVVDTEGSVGTDDLATITGGKVGQVINVSSLATGQDPTLKDGTGNLRLAGDFVLDSFQDRIQLEWSGSIWAEVSRSNNG